MVCEIMSVSGYQNNYQYYYNLNGLNNTMASSTNYNGIPGISNPIDGIFSTYNNCYANNVSQSNYGSYYSNWFGMFNQSNIDRVSGINRFFNTFTNWFDEFNNYNQRRVSGINNKPIVTYDADGNLIESRYDSHGNPTQTIYYDKNGDVKHFDNFNQDGTIKEKVDRTNNADRSYKDAYTDANGNKIKDNSYDTAGRLTVSTAYNSDGTKVNSTFDTYGNKTQDKFIDKDGKMTKSSAYNSDGSRVDTSYDANGKHTEDNYYDSNGQFKNKVIYRQGDGGYGAVDWNNNGKFGDDGGYDGYIAVHGDMDKFFQDFGQYWQLPDLEKIVNTKDGTAKDTDSRDDFVSNGKVTAHKLSDTRIGFNITAHDMSKTAGFNYNYVVWDKEKKTYTVGVDNNNDGNLTDAEVKCIVENVGNKTSSPLTFDLNGDGVKTSDKKIKYDIDGDGTDDTINDVADGTLCIRGGNSGKDLFGDNTDLDGDGKADGFANGFDALKALAAKEGLINGKDDMNLDSRDIKILEEKYQFGMKTAGYKSAAKSLEELGITEINLGNTDKVETKNNFDGQNNTIMTQEGSTFVVNGQKRDYADVWHSHLD